MGKELECHSQRNRIKRTKNDPLGSSINEHEAIVRAEPCLLSKDLMTDCLMNGSLLGCECRLKRVRIVNRR
jgi:hypothetical protein